MNKSEVSAAKHTPGSWVLLPPEADKDYIRVRGTHLGRIYKIANVVGPAHGIDAVEVGSNALLIAAAPDLLEALQLMASVFFDFSGSHGSVETIAMEKAEAAIAKATGSAQ